MGIGLGVANRIGFFTLDVGNRLDQFFRDIRRKFARWDSGRTGFWISIIYARHRGHFYTFLSGYFGRIWNRLLTQYSIRRRSA